MAKFRTERIEVRVEPYFKACLKTLADYDNCSLTDVVVSMITERINDLKCNEDTMEVLETISYYANGGK